jgi:hypothetical protein
MSFNVGNAFKYLYRCDLKGNIVQDIDKAIWYIRDEISRREKFRFRFFREDPWYHPPLDGSLAIRAVLENEDRFGGYMREALDRIYAAHILKRSVETTLIEAVEACGFIKNNYL